MKRLIGNTRSLRSRFLITATVILRQSARVSVSLFFPAVSHGSRASKQASKQAVDQEPSNFVTCTTDSHPNSIWLLLTAGEIPQGFFTRHLS